MSHSIQGQFYHSPDYQIQHNIHGISRGFSEPTLIRSVSNDNNNNNKIVATPNNELNDIGEEQIEQLPDEEQQINIHLKPHDVYSSDIDDRPSHRYKKSPGKIQKK